MDKFESEIELLQEIKINQEKEIESPILEKIYKKIEERSNQLIELEKEIIIDQNDKYVLAAESPKLQKIKNTETFKDKNNLFLAKVVNSDINNKIFLFKNASEQNDNVQLTLLPSNESFNISLMDLPLVISPSQKIDKIVIHTEI